jgi:hypothetical protein
VSAQSGVLRDRGIHPSGLDREVQTPMGRSNSRIINANSRWLSGCDNLWGRHGGDRFAEALTTRHPRSRRTRSGPRRGKPKLLDWQIQHVNQQPLMVRMWPGRRSGFPATYLPNADLDAAEPNLRGGSSEPIGNACCDAYPAWSRAALRLVFPAGRDKGRPPRCGRATAILAPEGLLRPYSDYTRERGPKSPSDVLYKAFNRPFPMFMLSGVCTREGPPRSSCLTVLVLRTAAGWKSSTILQLRGMYGDSTAMTGKAPASRAVFAAEKTWIFEASNLETSPIAPMRSVSCADGGWSSDASFSVRTGDREWN